MRRRLSRLLVAALVAALCPPAVAAGPRPIRVLYVTGRTDLPYHHWRPTSAFLRAALEHTGRFQVKMCEDPRGLNPAILADYDVLVLNYNGPRWGRGPERAVEAFLRAGGGMIAFHGVTYGTFFGQQLQHGRWQAGPHGDRGWRAYAQMLGVRWKPANIGHAPRHVYTVQWMDRRHPISRGLPATFQANDELYHKMDLMPGAHVLATAYDDPSRGGTGRREPQVWTVRFGRGRVVYLTFGHDVEALSQPGVLTAFARGAEWAATGRVTLPARVAPPWAPHRDAVRVLVVTGGHRYPTAFYTLFEGYADIAWTHATTLASAFTPAMAARYDVVVLHDMHERIGAAEKKNLRAFVESGKGVVSLHHAIVDYTSWPWWYEHVIGGKYFVQATPAHPKSVFEEGVDLVVTPVRAERTHPVLRGVVPLLVHDEAYRGMWHSPHITVLIETADPRNDRPVVYLGPDARFRAVYIQLGHSADTMRHPAYRRLVHNAILWAAGRTDSPGRR